MERFFIVKNEELISQVNEYEHMRELVNTAFKEFSDFHGIKATHYYQYTDCLKICATEEDLEKFGSQIRMDHTTFKKNSELSKAWVELCKKMELNTPRKPTWELRNLIRLTCKCRTRLFSLDGVVYGSYECDYDFELPEEHFRELKASEFWKIMEDSAESERNEG
jgi:hypothetical protein